MKHGRVIFMGDAAAQHSPFGARGGNRAVQDANNLAWKLALVLEGKAAPALLESYELERHQAAREAVEIASRSAVFIAPETAGQRLVRDAILDLAEKDPAARALVNVGRLSQACAYSESPLGAERGAFDAPGAAPGCAAPDGTVRVGGRNTHFADRLQGRFTVVYFGGDGEPPHAGVETVTMSIERASAPTLFERFGVKDQATYVFRPDGYVLARCRGIGAAFARDAILDALKGGSRAAAKGAGACDSTLERDRLYDALAALIDETAENERARVLAPLMALLAAHPMDPAAVRQSIERAR